MKINTVKSLVRKYLRVEKESGGSLRKPTLTLRCQEENEEPMFRGEEQEPRFR